jgi:general secretion pathway protein N
MSAQRLLQAYASDRPSFRHVPAPTRSKTGGAKGFAWSAAIGLMMGLVLYWPAAFVLPHLEQAAQSRTVFSGIRGSLWAGSAEVALSAVGTAQSREQIPGRLHWRWTLSDGLPQLLVRLDCCMAAPAALSLTRRSMSFGLLVSDLRADLQMSWLAGLGTPFNTLKPQGELVVSADGVAIAFKDGAPTMSGSVVVEANDFSSVLSGIRPMGSYVLSAQGEAGSVRLTLKTISGALRLSGTGALSGRGFNFLGTASPGSGYEQALSNLLNVIGRRQGNSSIISIG